MLSLSALLCRTKEEQDQSLQVVVNKMPKKVKRKRPVRTEEGLDVSVLCAGSVDVDVLCSDSVKGRQQASLLGFDRMGIRGLGKLE